MTTAAKAAKAATKSQYLCLVCGRISPQSIFIPLDCVFSGLRISLNIYFGGCDFLRRYFEWHFDFGMLLRIDET